MKKEEFNYQGKTKKQVEISIISFIYAFAIGLVLVSGYCIFQFLEFIYNLIF